MVTDKCRNPVELNKNYMRKHLEKYRGASFRRGDDHEMIIYDQEPNNIGGNQNNQCGPNQNDQ